MSISIGNNYNPIANSLNTSKTATNLQDKLKNTDSMKDDELMEVCKSFESYFVEQVFKEMKKTVPNSEENNEYMNYFGDMLYEEYAKEITDSGNIGIAKMLYESMKRN